MFWQIIIAHPAKVKSEIWREKQIIIIAHPVSTDPLISVLKKYNCSPSESEIWKAFCIIAHPVSTDPLIIVLKNYNCSPSESEKWKKW